MVTEGVDDSTDSPAVGLVLHWPDDGCAGADGTLEDSVGIVGNKDHASGGAVEGFGTEVAVLGRFVSEPELGAVDRQLSDNGSAGVIDAEQFLRVEGRFVELNRACAVTHGEHGGESLGNFFRFVRHEALLPPAAAARYFFF